MALIPSFFRPTSDWWDMWDWPERIFDQDFGMVLSGDDFFTPTFSNYYGQPVRRRRARRGAGSGQLAKTSGMSEVVNTAEKFQVNLDVSQFSPEEINVKVVDNNCIAIEGKHEEKKDEHGFISRQFMRKYMLPKNVDAEKIASSLSPDGILSIEAPKKALEAPKSSEKVIPIARSAPMETDDSSVAKTK